MNDNDSMTVSLFSRVKSVIVTISAVSLCVFHLYTAFFGVVPGYGQAAFHLLFVFIIGFFLQGKVESKGLVYKTTTFLLMIGCVASLGYIIINNVEILHRVVRVSPISTVQVVLGVILVVGTLELTRRTLGPILPIIVILFIVYAFVGRYIPGMFSHRGTTFPRFVETLYLTFDGIFGEAVRISSTFIIVFVLFGGFLEVSGGGGFFTNFSKSLVGRFRGGPGLMAVVASALMGTIQGSAVSNVVTTGVFTIPLMKKIGYEKNYAGAVETVASAGGQILPPVMGAGAFIMAEYTGVPYSGVIKHALFPALLYFFAVFLQVYFEGRRLNLPNIPKDEIPGLKGVLIKEGYLSLSLVAIIVFLMMGYSPMRSGLYGTITAWVLSLMKKESRMGIKKILVAMHSAATAIVPVAIACASAGIVIAVIRLTGLGLKFSSTILSLAGGNLILALILTMTAALVLGMGLPTTAAYIILAALSAPALIQLGLLPIQAHLFIFYFACISTFTPPVALAAFAAAPICGGNPFVVSIKAVRLGLVAFIVPFIFAGNTTILLIGSPIDILLAVPTAIMGAVALAIGLSGWLWGRLNILIRVCFLVSSLTMMIPGGMTDIIGLAIFIAAMLMQRAIVRRMAQI